MADGKGCKCMAKSGFECACKGVDWTPQELIDLREKMKKAEPLLMAARKFAEVSTGFRECNGSNLFNAAINFAKGES